MLDKILRTYKLICKDWRVISNITSKAGSITSLEVMYSLKNYCSSFNTIIDAGANKGQFALAASYFFPDASIYSFEANPDAYNVLMSNFKNKNNLSFFPFALGDFAGKSKFYKTKNNLTSSFLKPNDSTQITDVIDIEVKTLDHIFNDIKINNPALLKLDVQGYERQVLTGFANNINNIDYIIIEMAFIKNYQEEPLFNEINKLLNNFNFDFVAPLDFLKNDNYQYLQFDALYKNLAK